jgi:hypothetical protein
MRTIRHPHLTARTAAAIAIVAVGALAGAALSLGQGPGTGAGSQRLTACVHRTTGALRLVRQGRRCARGYRAQQLFAPAAGAGPTGEPGVPGPAGPAGGQGATGAAGAGGARGTFSFDSFDGMPCDDGSPGTIDVTYDSTGKVAFQC